MQRFDFVQPQGENARAEAARKTTEIKKYGGLAQLGERNDGIVEVRGSSPLSSTNFHPGDLSPGNHGSRMKVRGP